MSFANLKKNRGNVDVLKQKIEALNQKQSYGDDRIWYPKRDKSGNAFCVIRFLPAGGDEDVPWVQSFSHGFKGPGGKWYIENCPTTIGGKCPVCEANNELWNSGHDADKDVARSRKRKLSYIANILVIKDSAEPENEGKVFLYKFGKKIFGKIEEAMDPEFEDESPVNPFDLWAGANFKLKVRKYEGYANYDKSEFEAPSGLFDGDEKQLKAVYEQLYPLQEIVGADKFKKYDELKTRLFQTIGQSTKGETNAGEAAAAPELPTVNESQEETVPSDGAEAEEGMAFFKKLAGSE